MSFRIEADPFHLLDQAGQAMEQAGRQLEQAPTSVTVYTPSVSVDAHASVDVNASCGGNVHGAAPVGTSGPVYQAPSSDGAPPASHHQGGFHFNAAQSMNQAFHEFERFVSHGYLAVISDAASMIDFRIGGDPGCSCGPGTPGYTPPTPRPDAATRSPNDPQVVTTTTTTTTTAGATTTTTTTDASSASSPGDSGAADADLSSGINQILNNPCLSLDEKVAMIMANLQEKDEKDIQGLLDKMSSKETGKGAQPDASGKAQPNDPVLQTQLQMALQRRNELATLTSNVLKGEHDTRSQIIGNIR